MKMRVLRNAGGDRLDRLHQWQQTLCRLFLGQFYPFAPGGVAMPQAAVEFLGNLEVRRGFFDC